MTKVKFDVINENGAKVNLPERKMHFIVFQKYSFETICTRELDTRSTHFGNIYIWV